MKEMTDIAVLFILHRYHAINTSAIAHESHLQNYAPLSPLSSLIDLLGTGLILGGELQQLDDLGMMIANGYLQGSSPIIQSLVDICSSLNQDPHHIHMTRI